MIKVRKIDHSRLRNNEHFELMRHIVNIITATGAEVLRIAAQFAAFTAALAREDEVLMRIPKSALTARIAKADARRNELFAGLSEAVRAYSRHFTDAIRESAKQLLLVLNTYGNVTRLAFEEETSAIYNLVQDLRSDKYAEDVTTLSLATWITELDDANRAFEQLMEIRNHETAGMPELTMKEARAEVDVAYASLADALFAQGFVASSMGTDAELTARFESVVADWNGFVERAENTIATRRGRTKAKKEEEEHAGGTQPEPEE